MDLTSEAAYLYIYSKKFIRLNKELKSLSKKAEKHREKHETVVEHKKEKHRQKHINVISKIKKLKTEHNKLINKIHHHYSKFYNSMNEEHRI